MLSKCLLAEVMLLVSIHQALIMYKGPALSALLVISHLSLKTLHGVGTVIIPLSQIRKQVLRSAGPEAGECQSQDSNLSHWVQSPGS